MCSDWQNKNEWDRYKFEDFEAAFIEFEKTKKNVTPDPKV